MDVFWLILLVIVTLLFTVIVSTAIASKDIRTRPHQCADRQPHRDTTEKMVRERGCKDEKRIKQQRHTRNEK